MKKYTPTVIALMLIIGLSSGVANAGSSTGSSGSSGSSDTVHFTSNTPSGTTGYTTNSAGKVTGSFSTNCGGCATGAQSPTGGGGGNGGGYTAAPCDKAHGGGNCPSAPRPGPTPPPPPVCTITADKTVIGLGQSAIKLSWTPTPTTNVSLQRQSVGMKLAEDTTTGTSQQANIILAGGGGTTINKGATTQVVGKVLIAPPSTAESFTDTVNVALQGAGTNMTTVISKNGNVSDQEASIILAGGGGTTVNQGKVIKTAVSKDGGTITYNLSFDAVKNKQTRPHPTGGPSGGGGGGNGANYSNPGAVILAGGGGSTVQAPVTYTCSVTVKIVAKITECNDGIDNADPEDTLIDQQDPGCHTDRNPANAASYDPTITSETNNAIDLIPHITAPQQSRAQKPLQVSASAENLSAILAPANTLVTGWRNTGAVGTPSCGVNGSQCFTANGHSYIRMGSLVQSYLPHILQFLLPQSFTPPTQGAYEVCAVADYYNVVDEGAAGEANNVACQTVQVLAAENSDNGNGNGGSTITGPISLSVSPTRIKKGNTATLTWNTGGRTKCTIKGINGQVINLTGAPSATTGVTPPITSETKYTLSCADDNSSVDALVKLLPQYQEI